MTILHCRLDADVAARIVFKLRFPFGDVRLHADQPWLGRGSDRGEEVRGRVRAGSSSEDRTGLGL